MWAAQGRAIIVKLMTASTLMPFSLIIYWIFSPLPLVSDFSQVHNKSANSFLIVFSCSFCVSLPSKLP